MDERVRAAATNEEVCARASVEVVIPSTAKQNVVSILAVEGIVASAIEHDTVSITAEDAVVAATADLRSNPPAVTRILRRTSGQ